MPASVADPIETQLCLSLSMDQDGDTDITKRLAASCSRVLTTHINCELVTNYHQKFGNTTLKNKCITLKSNNNHLPSTSNTSLECAKPHTNGSKISPDEVLPTPNVILFPPELVQLSWQTRYRVNTGMVNVGNSCYLNASLQALFHVPSLVNWLHTDKKHRDGCIKSHPGYECIICAMATTLESVQHKSGNVTRPTAIISKLKRIGNSLQHGQQEDAHEFMRLLIECMEKSYLLRYNGTKLDSYSKETTPLNQIFGGYIRTEVQCKRCSAISTTFQHFQDLQLDIQRVSGVVEALRTYFSLETLDRADYSCVKCAKEVAATKRFYVERPPPVLFLQLKRFNAQGFKMNKCVSVPPQLDLTPYLRHKSHGTLQYRLTSLVNHSGSGAQCGHYTAVGRTSSNQLYTFDDNRVTPLGSINNCESNVYVIIYEQMKPGGSPAATLSAAPRSPFGILANNRPSPMSNKVSPTIIPTHHKPTEVRTSPLVIGNNKFIPAVIATPKKMGVGCSPMNGHNRINGDSTKPSAIVNGHKRDVTPSRTNGLLTNTCVSPSKIPRLIASPIKDKPVAATNGHSPVKPQLNGLVPYDDGDTSSSDSWPSTSNGEKRLNETASVKSVERRVNDSTGVGWSVTERSRSTSAELEDGEIAREKLNLKRKHDGEKANDERGSGNNTPRQSLNTSASSNGSSRDRHSEVTTSNPHDRLHADHNGAKRPTPAPKYYPDQSWEAQNEASSYLKSQSHRGLGGNVPSWSGGKSHVDRDAGNEFRERKRAEDRSYNEDYDRGRSKKVKGNNRNNYYTKHSYQKDKDKYGGGNNVFFWQKANGYKDHKHRDWTKDRKNRPRDGWSHR